MSILDIQDNILIHGEPMLIKQAVSNLIQNSADFGRQGDTIKVKAWSSHPENSGSGAWNS